MNIFCTDDNSLHLTLIQQALRGAASSLNLDLKIIGTASTGQEAFDKVKQLLNSGNTIDLVTLDIRMPELDGLSALIKLKNSFPSLKICMASSEDDKTVARGHTTPMEMSLADKLKLIEKVAQRIISGAIEQGKINKVLDGCDQIALDPQEVAKKYGALAFLHKPYKIEDVQQMLKLLTSGGSFTVF